jgi:hypothetical protein
MKALLVTREQALSLQARLRAAIVTDGSDLVQVGSGPHTPRELCRTREAVEVVEHDNGTAEVLVPSRFEARLSKAERDALATVVPRLTPLR